jgi:hypothetical protein
MYKFERLEVNKLALDYIDLIYDAADKLPPTERYNLIAQIKRAVTSIALNMQKAQPGKATRSKVGSCRWLYGLFWRPLRVSILFVAVDI